MTERYEKYEKGQHITHVNCGECLKSFLIGEQRVLWNSSRMRILCKDCREGTRHEL